MGPAAAAAAADRGAPSQRSARPGVLLQAAMQLAVAVALLGAVAQAPPARAQDASSPPTPAAEGTQPGFLAASQFQLGRSFQPMALGPAAEPAADGGSCEMTLHYTVNLGAENTGQPTPIFQGVISTVGAEVPIDSWIAGWRFADNATIRSQDDILASGPGAPRLLDPGSSAPIMAANSSFTAISFIGSKSPERARMDIADSVEPIDELVFNNLGCYPLAEPKPSKATPPPAALNSTKLEVQYAPVELIDQPVVSNSTTFLLRVRNVQNLSSIDLNTLSFQYFFSPDGLSPLLLRSPWEAFQAACLYTSLAAANSSSDGCGGVRVDILPGYPSIPGAEVVLNVTLTDLATGRLRPTGNGASAVTSIDVASILDRGAIDSLDMIFMLTTVEGLPLLNATRDYSYMDTPLIDNPEPSRYISRSAVDNVKVQAYIDGRLVWGVPPPSSQEAVPDAGAEAGQADTAPPYVHCDTLRDGSVKSCLLTVTYCCTGPNATSPSIPEEWPPAGADVSWLPEAEALAGEGLLPTTPGSDLSSLPPVTSQQPQQGQQGQQGQQPAATDGSSNGPGPQPVEAPPSPSSGGGGGAGAIAGIAAGVAVAAIVAAAGLWVLLRRRRRQREQQKVGGRGDVERLGGKDDTAMGPLAALVQRDSGDSRRSGSSGKQALLLPASSNAGTSSPLVVSAAAAASENAGGPVVRFKGPHTELAFLERKATTAPSLFHTPRRQTDPGAFQTPSSKESGDSGSTSDSDASDTPDGSPPAAEPARRSKSWDGIVQAGSSWDSVPELVRRRRRKEAALPAIPPVTQLPPPVSPHAPPLAEVDLNVDYKTEIEPNLGRCLGTGGFGAVYEAVWRGRRVAVKKLPQQFSQQLYDALIREIHLTSKFGSDRLVRVFGASTKNPASVCLIMELMEGGNLFQRIYDHSKRRMSYLEILQLAHDMAAGLAYLHPSVVHRDLKPQNVLLDKEGRAKLADFGISRVKDPAKSYLSSGTMETGTPMYMAPEQFNGSRVDEKVDVFALGVILNECWTRRAPWKDSTLFFQIILKVAINGERPWMDPDCPDPLRKLITRCWHQDRHMRPSPAELMRLTEFMIQEELRRWELPRGSPHAAAWNGAQQQQLLQLQAQPSGASASSGGGAALTSRKQQQQQQEQPSATGTVGTLMGAALSAGGAAITQLQQPGQHGGTQGASA